MIEELDELRGEVAKGRLARHELSLTQELIAAKRGEALDALLRPDNREHREEIITLINVLDSLVAWLTQVAERGEGAADVIDLILQQQDENV